MTAKPALALIFALTGTLSFAACSPQGGKAVPAPASQGAAPHKDQSTLARAYDAGALVEAVVTDPARSNKDRADDGARKPGAVLAFTGIAPGMTVLEMEAGSGYYTQMLSALVGPRGHIIMQNPASFDHFLGDVVARRLADNRLANVRLSKSNFDHLDAPTASVDVATWFLGPHELYYTPKDGQSLGDPQLAMAEIFRVLKPRGLFVVLDHAAKAGAPSSTGNTLHRIDPAIVKTLAKAAGLSLADRSAVLANTQDDHTLLVFDPRVRRKTDRFLFKFVKPAS